MPVAFVSDEGGRRFVPLAPERFRIGSDVGCDLVEPHDGVGAHHAEVRYVKGEYLLTAAEGRTVDVNARIAPLMALRDGDTVRFAPDGPSWRFRHRMEGSFRPPGTSLADVWLAHPAFRDESHGPDRFGPGEPLGGRDPARCRRVRQPGGDVLVVRRLGAVRSAEEAEDFLRLLTALGGAPHEALAAPADGGLCPGATDPQRWLATRFIDGVPASDVLGQTSLQPGHLVDVLAALAAGLAHLHARGVVHGDVAPGNLILTRNGGAALIDFGHAFLVRSGRRPSRGVVGTPGYVAPEAVVDGPDAASKASDCYGWAAVGYALATGRAPAAGDDVLERLAGSTTAPPTPGELGVVLPPILETVLMQALSVEPEARPDALDLRETLTQAAGTLRSEGGGGP